MEEKIHFYYTNDVHSYFDHWPRVVSFLNAKRKKAVAREESFWTIDIGDHMDRVHPITEATMGKANVELLNKAGYDVVTLGNNEGITLGHGDLFHLYDDADFDVVCANLTSTTSHAPTWLNPYKIVTSEQGTQIAFIGLTARFNPYYHLLGWDVRDIQQTMEHVLSQCKQHADIIVVLSHLGISEDQMLARNFPEIDLIIGGHTHHLLKNGQEVENTLLTAAGKHAAYVGEVTLTWDHEKEVLSDKQAHAIDITHLPEDETTVVQLNQLKKQAAADLNKKIISVDEPILIDWYEETPLMKCLTEKLRDWTKADCAMLNAGILVENLPAGSITYADVHRMCPHPINPVVVTISGEELTEVVRAALTKQFMEMELKGFGFRGKVLGKMVFANLAVQLQHQSGGHDFVEEILIDHKPLEPNQIYKVATGDLFTFGRLLPPIARSPEKTLFLPEFIREILVHTLLDFDS